jgi:DNA adenine methylase
MYGISWEWHQARHSPEHYYAQRAKLESLPAARAARFIYLNRACWNGLYRVNLKGRFNVPKGSKETIIFPDDNFGAVASALKNALLRCSDFEKSLDQAQAGDFVFLDHLTLLNTT